QLVRLLERLGRLLVIALGGVLPTLGCELLRLGAVLGRRRRARQACGQRQNERDRRREEGWLHGHHPGALYIAFSRLRAPCTGPTSGAAMAAATLRHGGFAISLPRLAHLAVARAVR